MKTPTNTAGAARSAKSGIDHRTRPLIKREHLKSIGRACDRFFREHGMEPSYQPFNTYQK